MRKMQVQTKKAFILAIVAQVSTDGLSVRLSKFYTLKTRTRTHQDNVVRPSKLDSYDLTGELFKLLLLR